MEPAFQSAMMNNNIFKLAKASSHEVRVTFFLLSCTNIIKSSLKYLLPEVTFVVILVKFFKFFEKALSDKFYIKYKEFESHME